MRTALAIFLILSGTVVNGQQRSPAEMLREAGKLATDADRAQDVAVRKVQAGADRKLIREAQKLAAENFEKAIELWREAGDQRRLKMGMQEVTRIYLVMGETERVIERLTREAEYWRQQGNIDVQAEMLLLLGERQAQLKRDAAATETLQQVVTMSRAAGLWQTESNALTQLATLYENAGRTQQAESFRQTAKSLWYAPHQPSLDGPPAPVPPATLPAQWVDLPGAPATSDDRVIEAVSEKVLVNRSAKGIELVIFGCVDLEGDGKTRVLYNLIAQGRNYDGGVRPGSFYRPFHLLNGPLNRWTDQKMACEGSAKMTLIQAQFDDHSTWKADGVVWARNE